MFENNEQWAVDELDKIMNERYEGISYRIRTAPRGKSNINISDLADLFGITAETLRKYDHQKIIEAFRQENGYRHYSSWELTKVICVRQLRMEGYPLSKIAARMHRRDGVDTIDQIDAMEKQLQAEIEEKQRLIHWLQHRRKLLKESKAQKTDVHIESWSSIYCCVYMAGNTMVKKNGADLAHLKAWMQALPYVSIYYLCTLEGDTVSCLGITEEERQEYQLDHLVPDFILPHSDYATCNLIAQHSSNFDTSMEFWEEGFQKASELNLTLEDIFVVRVVDYIQQDGIYSSYNHMMIPIRKL
jgi:DNA-binding transcriptional MerR regulator